jgi:6-phosphogluconolactonase
MRFLTWMFAAIVTTAASAFAADDKPLVFISAFASGDDGAIHAYDFDLATGELKLLERTTGVQNPFFMAVSPDNRYLYSIHAESFGKEPEYAKAFALEGRTGKLKPLNQQATHGTASCYLDVDATGKLLLVSNYSSGNVASFPIRRDGSLREAASVFQHEGAVADPVRQKEPHAHCFVISPNNKFAYAADLGIDQIRGYLLDLENGKIKPMKQPFVRTSPRAGPRHLTFHPKKPWMFVINEIQNSVTRFDYDAETGALTEQQTISTVPADFTDVSNTADVKITPDGKHLYGTNRGHDSVACYKIGDDGTLTLITIEPSLGKGPQNLAITKDGKWLLCANMPANKVVVFAIDGKTGQLKATGDPVTIPGPSCILIR